jgi:hypothetical protein
MKPFEKASLNWPTDPEKHLQDIAEALGAPLSDEDARKLKASLADEIVYVNDMYQVNLRDCGTPPPGWPPMVHLSIKRRDKLPIHDWRDLQEIKNLIVGPEHEGVELYPKESRLVDTANQYHLWVIGQEGVQFPFGMDERLVSNTSSHGAVQRPREDDPETER